MSLVQIVAFLQVASLALFVCVLLAVDRILYNIFDLIRRHTFTTYSVTSEHKYRLVHMHEQCFPSRLKELTCASTLMPLK